MTAFDEALTIEGIVEGRHLAMVYEHGFVTIYVDGVGKPLAEAAYYDHPLTKEQVERHYHALRGAEYESRP